MKEIPKSVSSYMSGLALKAAAKIRGTEAARLRSAKAVAARQRKRAERKALLAAGKTETPTKRKIMAETIDLSYLSKFPGEELLARLYARNGLKVRDKEGETWFNEFALKFRNTLVAGNAPTLASFSFGRRILLGGERVGVTFKNFLFFEKGVFGSLAGIDVVVDYHRGHGREKKWDESYELNEVPAALTSAMLGFRVSKQCFARIDEAYQELISELSMPVEHSELHTDTSDRDL